MGNQAYRVEVYGVTPAQAAVANTFLNDLYIANHGGVTGFGTEYTNVPGNSHLDQGVFRIVFTGPDVSAFKTILRDEINSRLGRFPDVEVSKSSDLDDIKAAYQTYGSSITNRAALEAALKDIWKNGARCMSGSDKQQLDTWIVKKGFFFVKNGKKWADYQALRQWLKERP